MNRISLFKRIAALAGVFACWSPASTVHAQKQVKHDYPGPYSILLVGGLETPPGAPIDHTLHIGEALAVSDNGIVAGTQQGNGPDGYSYPFYWTGSSGLHWVPTIGIGSFPGCATGVNSSGQVVSWLSSNQGTASLWWDPFIGPIALPSSLTYGETFDNTAEAINARGWVTGHRDLLVSGGLTTDAYLWSHDAGYTPLKSPERANCAGFAIDSNGVVAGKVNELPVVWPSPDILRFLPLPPTATYGSADAISDSGLAAGSVYDAVAHLDRPIVWNLADNGYSVIDVGFDGQGSPYGGHARGINYSGDVVGVRWMGGAGPMLPFLLHNGTVYNLNTEIGGRASGWLLFSANAINGSGCIVGQGLYQERRCAYMLVPTKPQLLVAAPPTAVAGYTGSTGVVTLAKPAPIDIVLNLKAIGFEGAVTVPDTITIRQNESVGRFPITTSRFTNVATFVTEPITGTLEVEFGGNKVDTPFTIVPLTIEKLQVDPNPILSLTSGQAKVTLNTRVQAGMTFRASSSNPAALSVPSKVTVPPGNYHYNHWFIPVAANHVEKSTPVIITVWNETSSAKATVTVIP